MPQQLENKKKAKHRFYHQLNISKATAAATRAARRSTAPRDEEALLQSATTRLPPTARRAGAPTVGDATRTLTTQDRAAQSSGARLSPTELRRLARLMFKSRRSVAGARRLLERPLARPAAVEKAPRTLASDTDDATP